MKIAKRIGYGILSVVPLLVSVLIQLGVLVFLIFVCAIAVWLTEPDNEFGMYHIGQASLTVMDNYMMLVVTIQLVMVLVFGLWYYLACVRKKPKKDIRTLFRLRNLAGLFLVGMGLYLLISLCLAGAEKLVPDVVAEYENLVDLAGLADLTFASTLATAVLAPLGEEMAFRGLTMHYLRKAGAPFILANLIQAALFGLGHFNWVQSSYAFVLGLLLGYLACYFDTLAASMLLHCIFNILGTYVAIAMENVQTSGVVDVVIAVLAVLSLVLAYRLIRSQRAAQVTGTDRKAEQMTGSKAE